MEDKHVDENRGKVIETIRQMMKIADPENGGFEGEIAAASAMIQKLIDKYCIEEYELQPQFTEASFDSMVVDILFGRVTVWQTMLAVAIGRITHTRIYTSHSCTYHNEKPKFSKYNEDEFTSGRMFNFYGRPDNIKIAVDLFSTWVFRIDEMATGATSAYSQQLLEKYSHYGYTSIRKIPNLGTQAPVFFRNSWLAGCMSAINSKISDQEKARSNSTSSALVIYDTKLNEKWNEFSRKFTKSASTRATITNSAGFSAGQQVGYNLNLASKSLPTG